MKTAMAAAALGVLPLAASADRIKRLPAVRVHAPQIDPYFAYYQDRSAESVARELETNGYKAVSYVVTGDATIDDNLIEAFHERGIAVWYQTFGNGTYAPQDLDPVHLNEWKMRFLGPDPPGTYTFLSLSHPDYIAWKKARIVEIARKHAFDGIEIAETIQMAWNGPENPHYGDLHPAALAAFSAFSGYSDPPDFLNPDSRRFYRTDAERYRKWQDFRVHAVASFLDEIVNGPGGLRQSVPGIPFCAWTLANISPVPESDPAALLREWQGVDAVEIARIVKPDVICFQTNWPDWMRPDLPSDYTETYRPFTEPLRKAFPKIPFVIQTDIGSLEPMRRSRSWIHAFERGVKEIGAVGTRAYMYDLALWMYTEPPRLMKVEASREGMLLVFQKRLDPVTAGDRSRYRIVGPDGRTVDVGKAVMDGNLVRLTTERLTGGAFCTLWFDGIKDDPTRWYVKDQPANSGSGRKRFYVP